MKKSCKYIDVTNPDVILPFIEDCLRRHKKRISFRNMLKRIVGLTREEEKELLKSDQDKIWNVAYRIAEIVAKSIKERTIPAFSPSITVREDKTTGKERLIGRETPLQQFYDYVAVYGCEELWKRKFVPQQCSSIKKRGQVYGMKLIKGYIEKDNRQVRYAKKHKLHYRRQCKYFVKLDIKKCYPSIDKKVLFKKLKHDVGNEDILYLWKTLLASYERASTPDGKTYTGLMIGALPSQFAAQLLISEIYRHVMNSGKASHMVIFMDDMAIFGPNRRQLKRLVKQTISWVKDNLHLTIKPEWHIRCIDDAGLDMMGYVVHSSGKVSIRARNFLHTRRLFLRMERGRFGIRSANRLVSYKGFFLHSNSTRAYQKYRAYKKFKTAQEMLSRREKDESLLRQRTG